MEKYFGDFLYCQITPCSLTAQQNRRPTGGTIQYQAPLRGKSSSRDPQSFQTTHQAASTGPLVPLPVPGGWGFGVSGAPLTTFRAVPGREGGPKARASQCGRLRSLAAREPTNRRWRVWPGPQAPGVYKKLECGAWARATGRLWVLLWGAGRVPLALAPQLVPTEPTQPSLSSCSPWSLWLYPGVRVRLLQRPPPP